VKVLMVSKSQVLGAYHGKLRELAKLGVDLTVIVPPRWGNQAIEIRDSTDYKIRVVPCTFSGSNHFYFYRSRIGPLDADLVHLEEEPWSLATYQFVRTCVKEHKPFVFFTWQNIDKSYPPPFSYFERFSFKHASVGIAGTEEARDLLRTRSFSGPIAVIPQLGIDPNFFCRRDVSDLKSELGLAGRFVLGYIGRIVPEKGIADLIQSLASLPKHCILLLVGDGKFRRTAEQLAEQLGVTSRVRWIPQVSSLRVPDYMNILDVLVLPSRTTRGWREQFGRVLVEAMACETPVVGSSSAEIPKVIGQAGLVFPEGDVAALTEQLRSLYDGPGLAACLGAKGRARVLERFTHRRIAEETVKVYRQVFSGATAGEAEAIAPTAPLVAAS
jgi:glycosyltransferase involved in cell wall biosynthesis